MKKKNAARDIYRMRTHLIHGNVHSKHWEYNHHIIPPISASASYRLDSFHRGAQGFSQFGTQTQSEDPIYVYDRLDEPTRALLEENLAFAENGEIAVCFASGMAAVSAALGVTTRTGDEIIAHHTLYGCTYSLLTRWFPKLGITTKFLDLRDPDTLKDAITGNTRVIYFETPINPTLDLIDIAGIKEQINRINEDRERKVLLIVDNTFATPFCQRPLQLGADLVLQSLTKNVGGFGTDMGGVVVAAREFEEPLLMYRKDFGAVLSPRNAWPILVYGLPTLAARMVNQQKSAQKVAEFLEEHPKIKRVTYPGLASFPQRELARHQMFSYDGRFAPGSILYFVLKSDSTDAAAASEKFIDYIAEHAYSITLAVSLGQIRTLIEEPFYMTHSALPAEVKIERGMEPGGIRLSIGLEDWHDIIQDLNTALESI